MKIKIVEPGYAGYTGFFGAVEFKDAVSVDHVSSAEAALLSAILRVETVEGEAVGNLADFQSMQNAPAYAPRLLTTAEIQAGKTQVEADAPVVAQAVPVESRNYTQEELELIADKEGIAGLRKIADPLGIKGTSIAKLIAGIVTAQGGVVDLDVEQAGE